MGKALKTTGALIFKGKSLPFKMYFKCKLVSDNDMMKNSDMSMVMEGELKDLEKLKKNVSKKKKDKPKPKKYHDRVKAVALL